MNRLYIDTRNNEEITVLLDTGGKKFVEKSRANSKKAQAALPLIQQVLKSAKITPLEINQIDIETGPGSFTGLRVGISIANALAFAAKIKINGKRISRLALPNY
jgi:tRNA threonylcarbamoyladenosine biosynthesis protein TsaB